MDDQIRQALNDNTAMMSNLTGAMNNMVEMQRRSAEKAGINTKDLNDNFNRLGKSASDASAAQNSIAVANKKYEESMNSLNAATASTVTGLKSFTTALLDSERSFGKYGSTVTSFGDAVGNALKAFGPLGVVAGTVVQGLSKVAEVALKQADNLTKGYDSLAKVGGAGAISTRQIMDMGHAAGLMSKDLGKLTGVIKANSKDIAGLGLTAADGIKVFGQLTAITSEQRMAYSKLGVSQEDLIRTQADFLALQSASGNSLRSELKDKAKLQKATLEYQDNLLALSNLTGEDVESLKKKQKEAAMELNFMVKNRQDELRIRELTAQGRTQEAKVLQDELDARKKGNSALVQAAPELGKAVREFQASGTASGEASQAMVRMGLGPAIAEYQKTLKEGGDANKEAAKLTEAYNQAQDRTVKQVGTTAGLSAETAKAYGLSAENMQRRVQQEKDQVAAQGAAAAQVEAGKSKADAALDARAKLTELEIKAGVEIEKFIAKINPLVSGFNPTTIAGMVATGAAAGLGMYLAGKLAGGIFGKGGGGGMPGIPSTGGVGGGRAAPTAAGGRAAPTAAGGRAGQVAAGAGRVGAGGAAGGRGNVAGTLQTLGQGGGGMLENAAKGLAAFANPKVAIGAAAFGAAIVAIGAGIAGATWIMSKSLPSLAEGLTSFEKLDGEKLVQAGKGVGALGAGLAVFGAGGIAAGIGSIMSTLGEAVAGFFGSKSPAEKLVEFSKLDIKREKVEENAKSFVVFSAAMAAGGASGVASGIGEIASAIGTAATRFFEARPPVQKFIEFSKLDIDGKRAKANADAFVSYSLAMSAGISGLASGIGEITSSIGQSVTSFFKVDPPFRKFVEFSKLDIDVPRTKNNADAFVAFSKAMSTGAAGILEGLGTITSALGSAVTNFFKVDPPLRKFVEFSKLDINAPKTKINAEAFANFSMAMAKSGLGTAASGLGNLVSGIADGIGKLFGNKDAITKFVEFTKLDVDPDKAEKLGIAFAAYVSGMQGVVGAAMPAISGTSRPAVAGGGGGGGGGAVSGGSVPSGGGAVSGGSAPSVPSAPSGGGAPSGGAVSGGGAPSGGGASGGRPSPGPSGGTSPPIAGSSGSAAGRSGGAEVLPNFDVRIGNEVRKGGTVSWRTNNPGNISFADITKRHGALVPWINPNGDKQQRTVGIAVMPNLEAGENAQMELWRRPLYINRSIASGVKMWVEGKEYQEGVDTPKQYATDIAKAAGVDVFTKIKDLDDDKLRKLIQKQRHWEGYKPGQILKARDGGVFDGPESGYPVELHGKETVVPNFKIPNMLSSGQITKQELPFGSTANASGAGNNNLMAEFMTMMENKFNNLISAVEESNSTQSQILKYSRA